MRVDTRAISAHLRLRPRQLRPPDPWYQLPSRPRVPSWSVSRATQQSLSSLGWPDTLISPSGPSCSRWFSCSCCRSSSKPNLNDDERNPTSNQQSPTNTCSDLSFPSSNSTYIPSQTPTLNSLRTMKTPHLPLPPTLPYSPTSQPFLRHLQILSLSLLSTSSHESWNVYVALHSSLQPAIPDDVFASLLAHQLKVKSKRLRWARVAQLVQLAKQCDMSPWSIDAKVLQAALFTGLRVESAARSEGVKFSAEEELTWLWMALKTVRKGKLFDIPLRLRRQWVERILDEPRSKEQYQRAERVLEEIYDGGGGTGMDVMARKLVTMYVKPIDTRISILRRVAWCLARGIDICLNAIVLVMDRVLQQGQRSKPSDECQLRLTNVAMELIRELREEGAIVAADKMEDAFNEIKRRWIDPHTRGNEILSAMSSISTTNRPRYPQLYRSIQKLLAVRSQNFELLVSLSIHAIQYPGVNCDQTVFAVIKRFQHPRDTHLLIRLAHAILNSGTGNMEKFDKNSLILIFNQLVSAIPMDETYALARQLYSDIRAYGHQIQSPNSTTKTGIINQPHTWSERNVAVWRKLFRHAASQQRHLFFASRLYADFQADGNKVSEEDNLIMIRSIGMKSSSSRSILLDRHLHDAQWDGNESTEALVTALTTGLTNSLNPRDAELALFLSRQIMWRQQDGKLPIQAVERIILSLSRSVNPEYQAQARQLLSEIPPTAPSAERCLNAILFSLVRSIPLNLDQVVSVLRESAERGISASGRTASLVTRALLKAKHLESALAIFHDTTDAGVSYDSGTVGRLMVNLVNEGRIEQAEEVEAKWRAVHERLGGGYDLGVVGARVLVDVKKGLEVDLNQVEVRTGWKATKPFMRYLQTMKQGVKVSEEEKEVVLAAVESDLEAQDEIEVGKIETVGKGTRRPVKPLTRSMDEANRAWLSDNHNSSNGHQHQLEHDSEATTREKSSVDLIGVPSV